MRTIVPGLVTTIVPVYNRPAMLREAIASVLAQDYRPIEVVIVDDGSTDDTPAVAGELASRYPELVRCVAIPHGGAGPARNRGLTEARGEFIQYLDSDDLLLPRKFSRQVADLREHPECGVSYCVAQRPDSRDGRTTSHRTDEQFDSILPAFLHRRGWPTLSPLWRQSACERIGPWMALSVMEDWEYDCRAGVLGIVPVYTPEPLCIVRDHGGDRASGPQTGCTQEQWADYLAAHESVYRRLEAAGQRHQLRAVPFAKNLFRVARACAAQGYAAESRDAYRLASAACDELTGRAKLAGFRACASVIGWRAAARMLEGVRQAVAGSELKP